MTRAADSVHATLVQEFQATFCSDSLSTGARARGRAAMDAFMQTSWSAGDTLDYLAKLAMESDMWRGFTGQTHCLQCLCGSDTRLCKECTVRFVFVHVAGRPLSRMSDVRYHV